MANKIKAVAKFSEDAINMAFKNLSSETRRDMEKNLDVVLRDLGKKTKQHASEKRISDETVFRNNIFPQITRRIDEIERLEVS